MRSAVALIAVVVAAFAAVAACSPAAVPRVAEHPASASAPTGRLAGPPAALRARAKAPAPAPAPAHDHAGHTP
jgi:hypothetical protein